MLPYIVEFLKTMILITLGDGVAANVTLNKSDVEKAGSIQIIFAWGLAVMLPVFTLGATSGAHFNSTLTIALAVDGSMAWGLVPEYIVAQFAGAFVSTVIVYLLSKDQYDATELAATKLGTSCTGPPVPNVGRNILSEAVGTFALVFAIKGIGQVTGIAPNIDRLLVLGIIISVGMSLDGLTGHAINSVCDLGPRLVYAVLPIKDRGDSNWGYVSVVIIGPVVGAVAAVLLYQAIPWM